MPAHILSSWDLRVQSSKHRLDNDHLTNGRIARRDRCPYEYEIKDGRMFIEGEDFGDAVEFLEKGKKLRNFLRICHQVAMA